MTKRQEAIKIIEAVFKLCKATEDANEETLAAFVYEYAQAWTKVFATLAEADMLGRGIVTMMQANRLSGENLWERGAIFGSVHAEQEDIAWLHDQYVVGLHAIWQILQGAKAARS